MDVEKKRIFVLPGEIAVTRQPAIIATLLGSCVAVCLYNRKLMFGGMNHFMLPAGDSAAMVGKYGDVATDKLIGAMTRVDPDLSSLQAKVYGGGAVVGHLSGGVEIGRRNIEMALSVLARNNIKVVENQTGGELGRKIFFDNQTGEVTVRMIQKSELTLQLEAKKKDLSGRRVRTLIVDDSSTVRGILNKALSMDPGIDVVGEAENAYEARDKILELDPDVITLDIIMPRMDGVSFLKKLVIHYPKPVIVVSSVAQRGSRMRLRAQDIGAVDVVDKEDLKLYKGLETVNRILAAKVKMAAGVHVGKRREEDVAGI